MAKLEIRLPKGYNPKTQRTVGLIAAQLDDQLKLLKKNVKDLTVEQLEWQLRPGMNTIGMLLAHLALAEFWWIKIAPLDVAWEPEGQAMILKALGFEDDGIPRPPDGVHPDYLRAYTSEKYLAVLAKVRRAIHREMKASWFDRDLDKYYRRGKRQISRSWTLYHILEHFAGHYGQILLLKHLMRDAGVLVEKDKK